MKAHNKQLKGFNSFPKSWEDPDTGTTYPKLFLDSMSETELSDLGWQDVIVEDVVLQDNEVKTPSALVLEEGKIIQRYSISAQYTPEQLASRQLSEMKSLRDSSVKAIRVTLANGITLDGDEKSQERLARAVMVMGDEELAPWIDADNNLQSLSKSDVLEGLGLAGREMSRIWIEGVN